MKEETEMREHEEIGGLLATYRDLGDADRRRVDQHVQSCAVCAARLASYREQDQNLARLADAHPGGRLRRDFFAAVATQGEAAPLARVWSLVGQVAELAVVILLIAALGFILRERLQSMALPAAPAPEAAPSTIYQPPSAPAPNATLPEVAPAAPINLAAPAKVPPAAEGQPSPIMLQGTTSVVTTTAATQTNEGQAYVVRLDDSLWKLAEKYLSDGNRFGEIVQATRAKHAEDASFAALENPNVIQPGSKLWIPAVSAQPAPVAVVAAVTPTAPPAAKPASKPAPAAGGPTGQVAFGFWNNSAERCTFEIDVINVPACLAGPDQCQQTRRIFTLNNVSEPALSPGGDRLAFRAWGKLPDNSPYANCAPPVSARHLASSTLDGTAFRDLSGFFEDGHPSWSPDGQRILFDSGRNKKDDIIRIYVVNSDGTNEQDLRIAGQYPSWAPDSQRFVYRGCDVTGNRCGVWMANAVPAMPWNAGSNLIAPVVQDEKAAHPAWSPVGDQIVYQSSKAGSWDLYVVKADGTGLRQLTADPGIEGLPAWSPDGQWVAYLSDASGQWGIWAIRADGSERHLLFSFDGGIFGPTSAVEPYGQRDWIDEQLSWSR
jgi:hypothetical protein